MKSKDQKIQEYDVMLRRHIRKADFVKFERNLSGTKNLLSGIILDLSSNFILIRKIDDFIIDGFVIIRKDQFESLKCGRFENYYKKILLNEKIISKNYKIDFALDLTSWQSIFRDLRKLDYHAVVECEELVDPTFTIGPIKRVTEKSVGIQYYNPCGFLDKKNTTLFFDDITTLHFGDRYSLTFRNYLRKIK